MDQQALHLAGWSALINTVAEITSFIALILFFSLGGFWGPLNDALSVIWALSLVPLAWLFYRISQPVHPGLSALVAVLGIAALLLFAVLQLLLVVGFIRYEQTLSWVLTLTGLVGAWLLANGLLAHTDGALPLGLVWAMLAFGAGLLCSAAGFWIGGQEHPLAALGFVVGSLAGMLWAAWLARWLLLGRALLTV